ncbi:MAG: transporter [Kiloniellales bacterium]|nr:transporter [Kiloniellales bacterium]
MPKQLISQRRRGWLSTASAAALCVALLPGVSQAETGGAQPVGQLDIIQQELQRLRDRLESQKRKIEFQENRIKTLEKQVEGNAGAVGLNYDYYPEYYNYPDYAPSPAVYRAPTLPEDARSGVPAQQPGTRPGRQSSQNGAPGGTAGAPGGQTAPDPEVDFPAVARDQSALLPPGALVVEPSIQYSLTSLNRVTLAGFTVIPAITVGSIDVREVDREVIVAASTFRLGITDFFEADVKVPYVYRRDSTTTRPLNTGASEDETTNTSGNNLGDIELGAHLQLWDGSDGLPFVIFNTRVLAPTGEDPFEVNLDENGLEEELPTGSGFWGVEPSFTFLYPSDPVVFFGTLGYLFNIEDDKKIQGSDQETSIDPGDAFRMSFGLGFAINERASFSLGYQHDVVFESEVDGEEVDDSDLNVGKLLIGGSFRVTDDTTVNLSVGVGATEEAPDIDLLLRVPIRFSIF